MKGYRFVSKTVITSSLLFASLTAGAQTSTQQPINTHFAQTQSKASLDVTYSTFSNVELDEADGFDGYSMAMDLTVPFDVVRQFRLSVPFYTDGDAQLKAGGQKIDIEGNGGVFDYATLQYEHQQYVANEDGYNLAFNIGAGVRTHRLKTTINDYYNHRGSIFLVGAKMDKGIYSDQAQLLINAGLRFYFDTDDLHPDGKTNWAWADIKSAVVFKSWNEHLQPVIELTYLGNGSDYNATSLMPGFIFPFGESLSFKLGGVLGLTNDGSDNGFMSGLSVSF